MAEPFQEHYNKQTGLRVGINDVLFSEQSAYQKVEIFETDTWGRMLVLDGMVMLSEKDEFVYHEMLTHIPLFTHPMPERVLIIGGGDGGTAREVLRHPLVQTVDLVEIDETVVRASKRFFPGIGDWGNPKLNIFFEDGVSFVKNIDDPYDVILIDGSDPVGPAQSLFEEEFLQVCCSGLTESGVLAAQCESPWVEKYHPTIKHTYVAINDLFEVSKMYLAAIPLYPAGLWSFMMGSKNAEPLSRETLNRVKKGLKTFGTDLKYYNEDVHKACFTLPNFVLELIEM